METSENYIIAEGPEGLRQVLEELFVKASSDPVFATQEHLVCYQLGSQKSLIKVDATQEPFLIWHYDLMGRPATVAVKDVIKQFLFEKWQVTD